MKRILKKEYWKIKKEKGWKFAKKQILSYGEIGEMAMEEIQDEKMTYLVLFEIREILEVHEMTAEMNLQL